MAVCPLPSSSPMPVVDPAMIVLATLVASLILFVTDALRYEVVAILVVLVLAMTGTLRAEEAFASFASPAIVLIVSMYVFGHAFTRYGVSEGIGARLLRFRKGREASLVGRMVLVSGLLSSFLSNTGVVATLIPVCSSVARRFRLSASHLLMPMSAGTLLGGLVTVIATSKNIAVNQIIEEHGLEPFALFEFALFGLLLLGIGALYFMTIGRRLLPTSEVDQSLSDRYQVPKFVTEVLVEPTSTLINRAVADTDLFGKYNISVLGIVRAGGEGTVLAPGPYNRIRPDDTLILQGEPDDIMRMRRDLTMEEKRSVDTSTTRLYSDDVRLVEAVVPAGSFLAGQTLESGDFHASSGCNVVALSKAGEVRLSRVQDAVLDVGDTLLLQGHAREIERVRRERILIVLDELEQPDLGRGALIAVGLLVAVLLAGTFTHINLAVLAMAGAAGLVLTGTVRAQEVPRVVNWSVVALLGGMLALGKAFSRVNLDQNIADWFVGLGAEGLSPYGMLAVLLVGSVLFTQVMNYIATAVIMAPVAISLATAAGLDPRPFLMAVIAGTEFAFMSPIAHQSNAMVLGPGGYRYKHFLIAGAPLTLVLVLATLFLIPFFWPLV